MIYMLWKECVLSDFYRLICREEYFLYLNSKNVLYPKVAEIVWKFIAEDDKNYNKLRNNVCQLKEIFQDVYAMVYPEIYCTTECRGFDLKSMFQLIFKTYKDKKQLEQLGKDPHVFLNDRNEQFKFEQKTIEIDDFNNQEEQEGCKKVEKIKKEVKQQKKMRKLKKRSFGTD